VRKIKASTMVLAIVLIISMALTGCGGGKSTGGNTDSTAPDAVQTLSIGFVADVRSLDSAKVTDLYSATALLQSNDGLVRITNDGTKDIIQKAGAESWTVSPEGWYGHSSSEIRSGRTDSPLPLKTMSLRGREY
jgi:ABC-type oligopeptide transport system substrate-binding subunit